MGRKYSDAKQARARAEQLGDMHVRRILSIDNTSLTMQEHG